MDVEAALAMINVEEISSEVVQAYLDLFASDIKEVEPLDHGRIAAHFGEYYTTSKMYKTMGGSIDLFKEFSALFMSVAMLHQNLYAMPKAKGSLLILEFEGHRIDWANWTRESILREIVVNRKKPIMALAHWLAILSPPPLGLAKITSRHNGQGTSGKAVTLTSDEDVYILNPLPEPAAHE